MSRYVVVGAGAVGSALAAEFARHGVDHVLVARGAQFRALARAPLRYIRPHGTEDVAVRVVGDPDEVDLRSGDVLILAVKAQQAQDTLGRWAWAPVDGGETVAAQTIPVVTLQNGVDTERAALRLFDTVLGASIWTPAVFDDAGAVAVYSPEAPGLVWLGRYPTGVDDAVGRVAADLNRVGVATQTVSDIRRWKAAKLLTNLANASDVFAASPEYRTLVDAAARAEAVAVFAAAGVSVADPTTESTLDIAGFTAVPIPGRPPTRRSTWQSLARGAGSVETDYLNGEIVLLGRETGVATPVNAQLQRALGRLANRRAQPGTVALDDVVTLDVAIR